MRDGLDRRTFLGGGALLGALGAACRGAADFPDGVASGDPRPDRVLLWTRVVASGEALARSDSDYTVKVLAEGLTPRTTY
jgi:phosphodiesterase/alkaline phosphatase D-like protein